MFTHMRARAGINKFGETVVASMMKEFEQLNDGAVPSYPFVILFDPA